MDSEHDRITTNRSNQNRKYGSIIMHHLGIKINIERFHAIFTFSMTIDQAVVPNTVQFNVY